MILLPIPNEEDLTTLPWSQLDDEPEEGFRMFDKYYLALGPTRSLLKAFNTYLGIEDPERVQDLRSTAARGWTNWCKQWRWRERADLFDSYTYQESRAIVEQARQTLLMSSKEAADTLRAALTNPRLQVAAAKEILDRAGVPAVKDINVSVRPYTSDEFADAAKEVEEWEAQFNKPQEIASEANG